jgi:hypothetical protein
MQIFITGSQGENFGVFTSWDNANIATRAIFKRQNWSDISYHIKFDNKEQTWGSIDLEPHSFHARNQHNIFTKHMKTFWTNVSKSENNFLLNEDTKKYFQSLLKHLPEKC